MRTVRLLLSLAAAAAAPAWALEPTDVRFHLDLLLDDQYDLGIDGTDFDDEDFDHAIGGRIDLVQPLNIWVRNDLISVIAFSYVDALDEDVLGTTTELTYQAGTFRYGLGYRAELNDSIDIDIYPYIGLGWASFELADESDPSLLIEGGIRAEVAVTLERWHRGGGGGYADRESGHTVGGLGLDVTHATPTANLFLGYRF